MKSVIAVMLLCAGIADAKCREGYVPTDVDGVCQASEVTNAVQPSDEKPPTDKMPSWQREGVVVVEAPNMAAEDERQDREKREAERSGKAAAGVP